MTAVSVTAARREAKNMKEPLRIEIVAAALT
jgi:hypothetical protein